MGNPISERISPTDSRLIAHSEAIRRNPTYLSQTVFGAELLEYRGMSNQEVASGLIKEEIKRLRAQLKTLYGDGNGPRTQYVEEFFEETKPLTRKDKKKELLVEDLFIGGQISDEQFEEMVRRHNHLFEKKREVAENRFQGVKGSFQTGLVSDIRQGKYDVAVVDTSNFGLPYQDNFGSDYDDGDEWNGGPVMGRQMGHFVDMQVKVPTLHAKYAEEVLTGAQMVLVDELTDFMYQDNMSAVGRVFFDNEFDPKTLFVTEEVSDRLFEETVIHELFHMLSGQEIVRDTFGKLSYSRVGLHYPGSENRFGWLNEAITERLTQEYMQRHKMHYFGDTYGSENVLFGSLLTYLERNPKHPEGTITTDQWRGLFLAAYFEHTLPSTSSNNENPAWENLQDALSTTKDPSILERLEGTIRSGGDVDAVLGKSSTRRR